MSRNTKKLELKNPIILIIKISANGIIETYNKEEKAKKLIIDLSESKSNYKINELQKVDLGTSFVWLESTFFLKGYDNKSQCYYTSSEYSYKGDNISMFSSLSNKSILKGTVSEIRDSFKSCSLSVCMNVYVMNTINDEIVKIELSASGRSAFFDFKDTLSLPLNENGHFRIDGLKRIFINDKEKEKTMFIPVFSEIIHGEEEHKLFIELAERSSVVCLKLDEYMDGKKSKLEDKKEGDKQLIDYLSSLPETGEPFLPMEELPY